MHLSPTHGSVLNAVVLAGVVQAAILLKVCRVQKAPSHGSPHCSLALTIFLIPLPLLSISLRYRCFIMDVPFGDEHLLSRF